MSEERLPGSKKTVGVIETELFKLVRYLETFGRRTDLYGDVERAGYILLRTLDRLGATSINALAEELHLDASTVTRQVARLETGDLVRRQPAAEDRRRVSVMLAPAGRRAMDSIERRRRQEIAAMLGDWSEIERQDFGVAMSRLNLALKVKAADSREEGPPPQARPTRQAAPPAHRDTLGRTSGQ